MAIASAVSVSATCIGDDMLLHGISADGGVGNIRDRSLALGPGNTFIQRDTVRVNVQKSQVFGTRYSNSSAEIFQTATKTQHKRYTL